MFKFMQTRCADQAMHQLLSYKQLLLLLPLLCDCKQLW